MKNDLLIPSIAWLLLTLVSITFILIGLKAGLKKTNWSKDRQKRMFSIASTSLLTWSALLLILSYTGFFEDFTSFPPRPALVIIIPLPIVLFIAFSKTGTELIKAIPSHWLIFMQTFRIAVELLLLMAFIKKMIPVQMTFEGRNFDILTGILAIPVGYLLLKKEHFATKLAIAFNIIGLLLLINILVIAVLSMPTPIRYFMNEPANTIVGQFPFILLPGILVPVAYAMNIFSLRQLLHKERAATVHSTVISPQKLFS